ncbi:MAG TPA: N-6 DNA methylase [Blastocatellia bacterium]|nr:N-6 DNA methylase [Blastocatellia bacterium]
MATDRGERHRYGQHYTPEAVARLLAALGVRAPGDLVLDPSCGDGRLLEEALRRKLELSSISSRARLARDLYGLDRSEAAARLARATGARVARADFFDVGPGAGLQGGWRLSERFDAVVANPPYIRQEVMGAIDKRRVERRLERDRERAPEIYWPRWSGRSDMYVYFFAHSTAFLKEGGRLVFLTASSWLDVEYGAALRRFLAENFRLIAVIESEAESFFDDASINTAITVAERESSRRRREENPVRFIRIVRPLDEVYGLYHTASEFARALERAASPAAPLTHHVRQVSQAELLDAGEESGWGRYLRAGDVFFRIVERGGARLKQLSDMARVRFGVKTGANDFFYFAMKRLGDVATVRRGLTTGANDFFYLHAVDQIEEGPSSLAVVEDGTGARHLIEREYLSPVIFSLKEINGILIEPGQSRKLLFTCPGARAELAGTRALAYIESGERAGYHLRPTCAARDRWYSAARGMRPAPLIFPSKVGERWVVALNRARVFEDKKLYGIFPEKGVKAVLLAALLNSTWARYYAEITCRQMTGAQAIADIDVSVAERILLPDPRHLSASLKRRLEAALNRIARRMIFSVFEEVNRADRRRLDDLVLEAIGIDDKRERETLLDQLYSELTRIVSRRLAR